MPQRFEISGRKVGDGCPPLLIAEVAQAHDGSLGMAHAFIDMVADAGADAVKFQTHIAAAESTPHEPWRVKFSRQDTTRYDYWKRMEFTPEQWKDLKEHANQRKLIFLSSPFSFEAIELLQDIGVPAWKVPSGEITNLPMIRRLTETSIPILLSSGMSSWDELDAAVRICSESCVPFAVFQCTTAYPCPPEKVGLNVLNQIRERYDCPVGLSDHSGQVYAGLAAVVLGAAFVEVHVTFHRKMFGPDVPASLDPEQLHTLAEGIRQIHRMLRKRVDKDAVARELEPLKRMFGKSIVAARHLKAGTILAAGDLAIKKPGTGLQPSRWNDVIGRRLRRDVPADTALTEADLEPPPSQFEDETDEPF
ncbi:MAG: N-acetylneuraminate synthase family protein [Verrucomicrobiae bacterium]|nr:N-acetylneuraminate synthase family protein [Verrucomicrobiae bacterium]